MKQFCGIANCPGHDRQNDSCASPLLDAAQSELPTIEEMRRHVSARTARVQAVLSSKTESIDSTEQYYAHMESDRNAAEAAYFDARPLLDREGEPVTTFRAGFERAYQLLWNDLQSSRRETDRAYQEYRELNAKYVQDIRAAPETAANVFARFPVGTLFQKHANDNIAVLTPDGGNTVLPVETESDVRALFNTGIGVLKDNRFSFSFETPEEAERAFYYIADLGTLETSQPPKHQQGPCEHLRSELLAEKRTAGEALFQMRKCLDCEKIFRVRSSLKSEAPHIQLDAADCRTLGIDPAKAGAYRRDDDPHSDLPVELNP